jgi:pheromone shutdown protein TraB
MQPVFGGTGRKEIDGVSKTQTKRIDDADSIELDNSRYQKLLAGAEELMLQAGRERLKDELDWDAPRKASSDIE